MTLTNIFIDFNGLDVELEIEYTYSPYIPATLDSPEEYADIEIEGVNMIVKEFIEMDTPPRKVVRHSFPIDVLLFDERILTLIEELTIDAHMEDIESQFVDMHTDREWGDRYDFIHRVP